MPNRLEPINLMSFVGGLNLRRNQFQLAEDESPDLLNVDIDPRGGFRTRRGWQRWNDDDIVDLETEVWEPRNSHVHNWSTGQQEIYVVNNGDLWSAGDDGVFALVDTDLCVADPHQADFATWGDDIYIAYGRTQSTRRRTLDGSATAMTPDVWSEVDAPTNNTAPRAEFIEAHGGYMFVASTREGSTNFDDRIRWSHPGKPDSWREDDFIDIEEGGGRITGLMSFQDHLLIFKTNSLHALYGYDEDSWQRIKVSISVGCPGTVAITRSETAVYFFSASDRGGVYAYAGEEPVYLSEKLRTAFEEILDYENVYVSWAGRRLWVSVPWRKDSGATTGPSSIFVWDTDVGNGAWTMYRSNYGSVASVVDGSDVNAKYPLAAMWSTDFAGMVTLDYLDDGFDILLDPASLWATPDVGYIVTDGDEEIAVTSTALNAQEFESYYRTRWLDAGWPDRKKSWRRPTLVCRQVAQETKLLVETYRDFDETTIHRTKTITVPVSGGAMWTEGGSADPDGFDWSEDGADPGAMWGSGINGSRLLRSGSLGLARAVQMKVRPAPSTPKSQWGVDGIVAKYVSRRFR
jgi:hypothetical protein